MNLMSDARAPTLALQAQDAAEQHLQLEGRLTAAQLAGIVQFEQQVYVAQVRFVGLPRPTVFRCIESLIQNVRNMKTSCPRAIDSRAALRPFSVSLAVRGS